MMIRYLRKEGLILPSMIALLLLLVAALGQQGVSRLQYDRVAIVDGELWRFMTGHLVHCGLNHLMLNLAGMALVFALFRHLFTPRAWLGCLLASMAGVSIGQLFFSPELGWYLGFSGVLHGLMVFALLGAMARRIAIGHLGLAAILSKLFIEQLYGPAPQTAAVLAFPIIVNAHLYGALAGVSAAALYFIKKRLKRTVAQSWSVCEEGASEMTGPEQPVLCIGAVSGWMLLLIRS